MGKTLNRKRQMQPEPQETLEDKIPALKNGAEKKSRKKKAKQTEFPGMEQESIPEIEKAAEQYVEDRNARMLCLEDELKSKSKLLELMQVHGLTQYKFDGKIVKRVPGEDNVKVRTVKEDKESDDVDVDDE